MGHFFHFKDKRTLLGKKKAEMDDVLQTISAKLDRVLAILDANTPNTMQLEIEKFTFVDETAILIARCASEKAALQWQQQLEGLQEFSRAKLEILDVNNQNGQVNFTMELSLAEIH